MDSFNNDGLCKPANLGTPTAANTGTSTPPVLLKTPSSGMSSSLKERLKKCGRYHPATPTSSRPMAQRSTPTNSSPLSDQQTSANRSPSGIKKNFCQPRNILTENPSHHSLNITSARVSLNGAKKNLLCSSNEKKACEEGNDEQSDVGTPGALTANQIGNLESQKDSVSKYSPSKPVHALEADSAHVCSASSDVDQNAEVAPVLQDNEVLTSCDIQATKKALSSRLAERKEVLRKLNMVKTYRVKNDLGSLQELIDRWRSACQEAIQDLHKLSSDGRPSSSLSLTQLVQQLGVDTELVCYNQEEECFD